MHTILLAKKTSKLRLVFGKVGNIDEARGWCEGE